MQIIEGAGHPVFTGAVPLAKGILIDEGASEHFTKRWQNEEMLVRLIYDSNMLTSFIALWKHAPTTQKVTPPAETRAQFAKPAGGDPVRSSSPAGRDAAGGRKRAAGDRGEVKASVHQSDADKRERSEDQNAEKEVNIDKRKRVRKGDQQVHKRAMPEGLHYMLFRQIIYMK